MIRLLNYLSRTGGTREELSAISGRMNLSLPNLISGDSLYKRRHTKTAFTEQLKDEEETPELVGRGNIKPEQGKEPLQPPGNRGIYQQPHEGWPYGGNGGYRRK